MPRACAANFDKTFTLAHRAFVERITTLPPTRLAEVCEAYRFAAGC
jgi:mRNA-degrading endonuclease toxin of MazEF toxin-antitoxin module